jgi:hypothetical protein
MATSTLAVPSPHLPTTSAAPQKNRKPIPAHIHRFRYDRRQVALMVKVAKRESPDKLKQLGVLRYFNLEKDGDLFVWNIQESIRRGGNHA